MIPSAVEYAEKEFLFLRFYRSKFIYKHENKVDAILIGELRGISTLRKKERKNKYKRTLFTLWESLLSIVIFILFIIKITNLIGRCNKNYLGIKLQFYFYLLIIFGFLSQVK